MGHLTVWTGHTLLHLVLPDLSLVSSADIHPFSPGRPVVDVPDSSPASCESILANEKESNLPVLQLRNSAATSWLVSVGPRALVAANSCTTQPPAGANGESLSSVGTGMGSRWCMV